MKTTQENSLTPIGVVRSHLRDLRDCPLQEHEQAPAATIEISSDFVAGIRDLKPDDQVLLLTWLHEADRSVIECYPRKQIHAPRIGVFFNPVSRQTQSNWYSQSNDHRYRRKRNRG